MTQNTLEWCQTPDAMARVAAQRIRAVLKDKPDALLAVPTGQTPVLLYEELARMAQAEPGLFDQARFINLDEFIGCDVSNPQSYGAFLWKHLFAPLRIASARVRLLDGAARDPDAECAAVDAHIEACGGIDLAILGLGRNGHIAFNEPGSDWSLGCHVVTLAEATRQAQGGIYPNPAEVPVQGITLGVATLRAARALILMISGSSKQAALSAILAGKPTGQWPVTAILHHPKLELLADEALR